MDRAGKKVRTDISCRNMRADDLDAVFSIEAASFNLPWTTSMFEEELSQGLSWREVATCPRGEVIAFLIGRCYPDAWHLMDLAVAPDWRRRGVGGTLLARFLEAADEAGVEVILEVRPGNKAATGMYEAVGFRRIGLRPGYYSDTLEDAVVMLRGRPIGRDLG